MKLLHSICQIALAQCGEVLMFSFPVGSKLSTETQSIKWHCTFRLKENEGLSERERLKNSIGTFSDPNHNGVKASHKRGQGQELQIFAKWPHYQIDRGSVNCL